MTIGATVAACSTEGTKVATGVTQITDRPDPGAPRRVVLVEAGLTGLTATQVVLAVPPPPLRSLQFDPTAGTDQRPESLRAAAEIVGFRSCWCEPVADPMHELPACFVTRSPHDASPALGQGQALEHTTRLISLALQQRDQQVRLVRAARQDRLTGLANRTRFVAALDDTLLDPGRAGAVLMLYIDLDDFKPVNDRSGHAFGDRVLVTIAERLKVVGEGKDMVARIGGDEFAILTIRFTTESPALRYADDVIAARRRQHRVVGASGVRSTSSEMLDGADQAVYQAKREGRNRWAPIGS